jgi:hypothetical protein
VHEISASESEADAAPRRPDTPIPRDASPVRVQHTQTPVPAPLASRQSPSRKSKIRFRTATGISTRTSPVSPRSRSAHKYNSLPGHLTWSAERKRERGVLKSINWGG